MRPGISGSGTCRSRQGPGPARVRRDGAIKNNGADSEIPALAAAFIKSAREKPFLLVTSFVNPHNICEWARGEELKDGAVGEPPPPERCPPAVENLAPPRDEADGVLLMRRSYQNNRLFPVGGFDENRWRQYRWPTSG